MNSRSDAQHFYRAFEDRYRGSRELIKSRLQVYIPLILPLIDLYKDCKALDLGCGRGEWLELLKENKFDAYGVDLDRGMLSACTERGLAVSEKDAITALHELSDESQTIVSGFHIAEHLPFDVLSDLMKESYRVLKPGGFLILETPNPENIQVATANFYLDPTHQRPLPQQLLTFLAEFYGFSRVKILRLQEPKELYEKSKINLIDVIGGVSPDYAVIAQKESSAEILGLFDNYFNKSYGISLDVLTDKFEHRLSQIETNALKMETSFDKVIERAIAAEVDAEARRIAAESRADEADARRIAAVSQAEQAETRAIAAEVRAMQAEEDSRIAWSHYAMVVNSHSWKCTYLLRIAGKSVRWFVHGSIAWLTLSPSSRPRRMLRTFVFFLKRKVKKNKKLKSFVAILLVRFPNLKKRLQLIGNETQTVHIEEKNLNGDITTSQLNPHAMRIYAKLKAAIEKDMEVS